MGMSALASNDLSTTEGPHYKQAGRINLTLGWICIGTPLRLP